MKPLFKKTIIIAIASLFAFNLTSKAQAFEEGTSTVYVGYGVGNLVKSVFKTYGNYEGYSCSFTGPLFLKYEYGVSEKIGFGLNIAYIGAHAKYNDSLYNYDNNGNIITGTGEEETIDFSSISFNARMNLHFGDNDKFDPYWGIGIGYKTSSWKFSDASESYESIFPLGFESTLGAKYLFTDNIGAYAEVGLAKAIIQFGLVGKF